LSGNLHATALQDPQQAEHMYQQALKETHARETVLTSSRFSIKSLKTYLVTAIKGENAEAENVQLQDFSGTKAQYLQILQQIRANIAFQLGNLYANQLNDVSQAERYYGMAADAGHAAAMNNLGYLYHYQQKDLKNAALWYQKAVDHGDHVSAALNLAMLYHNELQDYYQAEKYYLMACEQGDVGAMNGLAWLYFQQKRNRQEALEYAWNAMEQEKNIYTAHTLACIYVWNNRPEHAANVAREFIYNKDAYAVLEDDILLYLQLLLAKEQHDTLFEYFDAPEIDLADRFRPMVYAIFYFTDDARYNRLPSELAEPVEAIIRQVKRLAEEYA
jgi:TPR repeat protein